MSRLTRRDFLALSALSAAAPALPGGVTLPNIRPSFTPPQREIFLLECHVAGTSHVPIEEIEPFLAVGETLTLLREPENAFDALAILVLDARGAKLGYVPRDRNQVLARLLDAGMLLDARLERMQWFGGWLRVTMRIHLRAVGPFGR